MVTVIVGIVVALTFCFGSGNVLCPRPTTGGARVGGLSQLRDSRAKAETRAARWTRSYVARSPARRRVSRGSVVRQGL